MTKEENICIDKCIETTIRLLGLNNSYKEYNFLIYAVKLTIENPEILTYICKGLYFEIAIHYNTTITCAERNIRTAKEVIWMNGNKKLLQYIFGNSYEYSIPSNAVFIDLLAYYVKSVINK